MACVAEQIANQLSKSSNKTEQELAKLFERMAEINKSASGKVDLTFSRSSDTKKQLFENVESNKDVKAKITRNSGILKLVGSGVITYQDGSVEKEVKTAKELIDIVNSYSELARDIDSVRSEKDNDYFTENLLTLMSIKDAFSDGPIKVRLFRPDHDGLGNWNSNNRILSITNQVEALGNINPIKIIAHEYSHAITVEALKNKEDPVVKALMRLFDKVKKELNPNNLNGADLFYAGLYGLTDVKEFVAETLTSPKFQEKLKKVSGTGDKINIVQKVKEIFANFVYKTTGQKDTALDEALDLIAALTNKDSVELLKGKESTPKMVIGKTSYVLSNGYKANPDQVAAINTILGWWKNGSKSFMLNGRGGTGKTATISTVVKELGINPRQVLVVAPTYKAMDVIQSAAKGDSLEEADFVTVASAVGKQVSGLGDVKEGSPNQFKGDLIIVDESSMLTQDDYDKLVKDVAGENTKIIFMGDRLQLPPIASLQFVNGKWVEKNKVDESPVFKDHDNTGDLFTLREVMRQQKGSFLAELVDQVYAKGEEVIGNLNSSAVVLKELQDTLKGIKSSYVNGKGVVTTKGFTSGSKDFPSLTLNPVVLEEIVKDFNKDPASTKVIHYNNNVHSKTIILSNAIRRARFGTDGGLSVVGELGIEETMSSYPFLVNDPVVGGEIPIVMSLGFSDKKDLKRINSGVGAKVKSVEVFRGQSVITNKFIGIQYDNKEKVAYEVEGKLSDLGEIQVNESSVLTVVEIESEFNGELLTRKIAVPNEQLRQEINSVKKEWKKRVKGASFSEVEAINAQVSKFDAVFPDLQLGYVITTHKAQGSSYNTVYADVSNIIANKSFGNDAYSPNEAIKSIYTALSRAKSKLVIGINGSTDSGNMLKLQAEGSSNTNTTVICQG